MTMTQVEMRDSTLETALFLLRAGLAILFVIWAFDKLLNPEHTKQVLGVFYGQDIETMPASIPLGLGIAQLVLVALFALGMFKTVTYAAILLMHLASTIVSLKMHLDPFGVPAILFWANWPILGAAAALFLLRARDRMMSVH